MRAVHPNLVSSHCLFCRQTFSIENALQNKGNPASEAGALLRRRDHPLQCHVSKPRLRIIREEATRRAPHNSGHVRSWGRGEPQLLVPCGDDVASDGLLDPTRKHTYTVLWRLLRDVSARFPVRSRAPQLDRACEDHGVPLPLQHKLRQRTVRVP